MGLAADYARSLLADLGADPGLLANPDSHHPAIAWASSGAMALTGRPDQPPRMCPAPLAACADGVLMALASLADRPLPADLVGSRLLGERAAIAGYGRKGSISPGGSCRFLETGDGWIALNLARGEDWTMVPALVGQDIAQDWEALAEAIRALDTNALRVQGRELGLAIAQHRAPNTPKAWFEVLGTGPATPSRANAAPLVVDLSPLWAGPLCGHLLHLLGARVIKVESTHRPDGARQGPPAFFDLMNAGKPNVALDFKTRDGREQLRALLARADIVIEASRPRALRQLGIAAEALVAEKPGLTWISITGHGRTGDAANWVAFGDDAAVAAGLSTLVSEPGEPPVFCGDAIGDPLAGLHAALVAWQRWRGGAGGLIAIALADVIGHCIGFDPTLSAANATQRSRDWQAILDQSGIAAFPPRARVAGQPARPLGADTAATLAELGIRC